MRVITFQASFTLNQQPVSVCSCDEMPFIKYQWSLQTGCLQYDTKSRNTETFIVRTEHHLVASQIGPEVQMWLLSLFMPAFAFSHPSDQWVSLQDAAVWEGGLWGSGVRSYRGLCFPSGEVSLAGGELLQSFWWLVGVLRAPQLPRSPVFPGEGGVPQAWRLGCCQSYCAILQTFHWVTSPHPQCSKTHLQFHFGAFELRSHQ